MAILITDKERIRVLEREKAALAAENAKLKADLEYIAVCDYPEIFDEEETNDE